MQTEKSLSFTTCKFTTFQCLQQYQLDRLQRVQNSATRLITCVRRHEHISDVGMQLGRGPCCSSYSCLLGKSAIAGLSSAVSFKFQGNKNVSSPLIHKDLIVWGAFVAEK